jgi:hypothetical protein
MAPRYKRNEALVRPKQFSKRFNGRKLEERPQWPGSQAPRPAPLPRLPA